jgi:hypothetical protein
MVVQTANTIGMRKQVDILAILIPLGTARQSTVGLNAYKMNWDILLLTWPTVAIIIQTSLGSV